MSSQPNVEVISNKETMAIQVAERIQKIAQDAIAQRGRFTLVLTGGESPVPLYQALATDPRFAAFPWTETLCFFGDERHVPPEDSGSNFRLAKETFFFAGLVPDKNIIRIKGEIKEAGKAADDYETELRYYFPELESPGQFPRFDLILLGLGPNGHVASLFPDTEAIKENDRWVISNWIPEFQAFRITMTFPVLNAARNLFLQVIDPGKKELVKRIRSLGSDELVYPVQRLECQNYNWYLTEEVAG